MVQPGMMKLTAVYATLVLGLAVCLVPATWVVWLLNVPRWLFVDPVQRPASMRFDVPTHGSGVAIRSALRHELWLAMEKTQIATTLQRLSENKRRAQAEISTIRTEDHTEEHQARAVEHEQSEEAQTI